MKPFTVHVRVRGDTAVVELQGQLDAGAAGALDDAWEAAAAEPGPAAILLDFRGVTYMNSTGIALVVGLLGRARSRGADVLVCGLSDHYRHIFEITRLSDYMTFYLDEEAAVGRPRPAA